VLVLMSGLASAMLVARVAYTGQVTYLFLIWNLFLAWLPVAYAAVAERAWLAGRGWLAVPAVALWLLFLPNAPYIVTDLIHLPYGQGAPLWFDAIMIFSFALTGLLLGFVSLLMVHGLVERAAGRPAGWLMAM